MLICLRAALITEEPVVLRRVVLTDIQGSGVTVRSWSDSTFLYALLLSQRGGHLISLFHSSPLQLVGTTGRRAFPADSGVPLKCSKVLSLHKGGGYPSVLIVTEEEEEEGERKKKVVKWLPCPDHLHGFFYDCFLIFYSEEVRGISPSKGCVPPPALIPC